VKFVGVNLQDLCRTYYFVSRIINRVSQNNNNRIYYYVHVLLIGLARTIHTVYVRYFGGILGREITKYTGIFGVYIRFWPTLVIKSHYS